MLKIFKVVALLEGWSYLIMLFIGIPLKYLADNDVIIKTLGRPHGILFLVYAVLAIIIKKQMQWSIKDLLIIIVAAALPFGPFWVDKKYIPKK